MSKLVTAGMQSHLDKTVTSLATCWKVTRTDGKQFFFTDHDVDLNVDGDVYSAESGYTRTAVSNDSSLSVDNLDIEGILDSERITEQDLRIGKFDFAEMEVFLVNWDDLTLGIIKLRKGWLGEVTITPNGIFRTELRGLTQSYSQQIVEVYSPDCRVDLGDAKCKIPISPDLLQRNFSCFKGEFFRVVTNPTIGTEIPFNIVNASFDTGDFTGWTIITGTPQVTISGSPLFPFDGTHFAGQGTGSSDFEISQTVDITSFATPIDAGDMRLNMDIYRGNTLNEQTDTGQILIEALDDSDVFVATVYDSTVEAGVTGFDTEWRKRGFRFAILPATTRKIKIRLIGTLVSDTITNIAYDNLSGWLVDVSTPREIFTRLMKNGSFDWGDDEDWITTDGTYNVESTISGLSAQSPSWFFVSLDGSTTIENVVDLVAETEIATADIDADLVIANLSYFKAAIDNDDDRAKLRLLALDGSDVIIKTLHSNTWFAKLEPEDVFTLKEVNALLPSGTRKLKIIVDTVRIDGTESSAVVDSISLGLTRTATEGYEVHENVIYECTTAGITGELQPTFDTTIGNTTVDGTVTFTTRNSFTRHGEVDTVTDRREFTVIIDEPRAIDDWFKYGILVWLTGDNEGKSIEVKKWITSISTMTLFLAVNFDISIGDKFKVHAGCNKIGVGLGNHCIDKFDNIINFRGEPYVPGQDELFKYPDAR